MAEHTFDLADRELTDRVSVRLRKLQVRIYGKLQQVGMIVPPAARAEHAKLRAEFDAIAAIAYALEEGRLDIREPDEDTMAARMAADVEMHFGVYTPPPTAEEAGDAPVAD